jgi:hypothetical protein
MALRWALSSTSPALSAVSFAEGIILQTGQDEIVTGQQEKKQSFEDQLDMVNPNRKDKI